MKYLMRSLDFGSEFTDPIDVTDGGVITLDRHSILRVEHVGFEAGYINSLVFLMGTAARKRFQPVAAQLYQRA